MIFIIRDIERERVLENEEDLAYGRENRYFVRDNNLFVVDEMCLGRHRRLVVCVCYCKFKASATKYKLK